MCTRAARAAPAAAPLVARHRPAGTLAGTLAGVVDAGGLSVVGILGLDSGAGRHVTVNSKLMATADEVAEMVQQGINAALAALAALEEGILD